MIVDIYTKDLCGYCDATKDLFDTMGVKYNTFKIGTDITKEQLLEIAPNAKTAPQIVINGTVVGGYDDLCAYIENTGFNGSGY